MSEKPRPCDPSLAVIRALSLVGRLEPYVLGTGDYHPTSVVDLPFTRNSIGYGCDCWGFAGAWCYKLPRHRPGYNKGAWATVADDLNCDSAIEQAEHAAAGDRVWELVTGAPKVGDLMVMPSIRDKDGHRIRIGHVKIAVAVPAEWDPEKPQFDLIQTVECHAGHPAILKGVGFRSTGETYRGLTDPAWRVRLLRAVNPA